MDTKYGFTRMTLAEFKLWIADKAVSRTVRVVQQHHTWSPSYSLFTGENHFELQRSMKNTHVGERGWADIGQHFTIFPDGKIVTGRSLESPPACILGNNSGSICIENLGNFDTGKDAMTQAQMDAIVGVTAALCKRFRLSVNTTGIVYHHWFNLDTGARNNGSGNNKSCPGTAFFGGNKTNHCTQNFLPLVTAAMGAAAPRRIVDPADGYGCVMADSLNVRDAASSSATKIGSATLGAILRIHSRSGDWLKISRSNEEWVSGRYVKDVKRAVVNATTLNVRSGPGTQHPKVAQVNQGDEVFVHEESNGWCKVGLDARWVKKEFVNFA